MWATSKNNTCSVVTIPQGISWGHWPDDRQPTQKDREGWHPFLLSPPPFRSCMYCIIAASFTWRTTYLFHRWDYSIHRIPFVGIGSPNPLPLQAGVSLPVDSKGGGATQPIRTTGKKAWHSVYSVVIGKKGLTLLYMQSHRSGTSVSRLRLNKWQMR